MSNFISTKRSIYNSNAKFLNKSYTCKRTITHPPTPQRMGIAKCKGKSQVNVTKME